MTADPLPAPPLPPPVMLFDLDGTLTDSAPGIIDCFRHALAGVGAPEPSDQVISRVVGPPMLETLRGLGLDEDRAQRALATYLDRYDIGGGWANNSLFGGIDQVLSDLVASGVRLGVATSKSERLALRIIEYFGLAKYFEFVGGASDDLVRRAKGDVIEHTLRHLGIEPVPGATAGVVMVGDRHHDIAGAATWGIPTIYAGWGYGAVGESAGAVWVAGSVADLDRSLSKLHVTFVCTGNICRSPMAEKIFLAHLERAGLANKVQVSSAGTSGWHVGASADFRTEEVLGAAGCRTDHRAAQVSTHHLDADLVIALDTGHDRTLAQWGVPAERRRLLRSFDPTADDTSVPDPYYGDRADFEGVRDQIEAAMPGMLEWVRQRLAATVETCES